MARANRAPFRDLRPGRSLPSGATHSKSLVYQVPAPEEAQARARYVLNYLRQQTVGMTTDQQRGFVLGELRKINPFVLEELLLHVFADANHPVERPKYVADGGIDGAVLLHDELILIQTKRYNREIEAEHVAQFVNVVQQHSEATGGLFIHTGRTNIEANYYIRKSEGLVQILSGDPLVTFILCGL